MCHASVLKGDDYRLKGLPMSNRKCAMCDMFRVEDIFHLTIQCPHHQHKMENMYEEIYRMCPNAKLTFKQNQGEILYFF